MESIPGLHKCLKIRAQGNQTHALNSNEAFFGEHQDRVSTLFQELESAPSHLYKLQINHLSPYFKTFMEHRDRFQGMNFASLCSLAGCNYPIPTRCLAPIDFLTIPALVRNWIGFPRYKSRVTCTYGLHNENKTGFPI